MCTYFSITWLFSYLQFKRGLGAKRMMDLLTEDPPKVAVYGPGDPNILAVTGLMAPFFKVVEVRDRIGWRVVD